MRVEKEKRKTYKKWKKKSESVIEISALKRICATKNTNRKKNIHTKRTKGGEKNLFEYDTF